MKELTIKNIQEGIGKVDHFNNKVDRCFYKLIEEVGELSEVVRKDVRMENDNIKNTIEEEIVDVIYYTCLLANVYGIDLENCIYLKEEINAIKYNRSNMFKKETKD